MAAVFPHVKTLLHRLRTITEQQSIGERIAGSDGQPYQHRFENGMVFGLSTKRLFMPEGSPFEAVGIAPDTEVQVRAEDFASGKDLVLDITLRLAQSASAK